MTAQQPFRPTPVLRAPRTNLALILYARSILMKLEGNDLFLDPTPSLLIFEADIDAFDEAQVVAANRTVGTAIARDGCRNRVMEHLHHLRDYVQRVVETMPPEKVTAAILSAGMNVKKRYRRFKAELSATLGPVPGTVLLVATAAAKTAVYFWEYSVDQVNWLIVPETLQANATIEGLSPVTKYYFRFRARTRKGLGNYSQVVGFVVP